LKFFNFFFSEDFIKFFFERLEMDYEFPENITFLLDSIRLNGFGKIEFKFDEDFKKKFELDGNLILLPTHSELDLFVNYLLDKDQNFPKNHPNEFFILKSFDRIYWTRYKKFPTNSSFKYHEEEEDKKVLNKCPFKNDFEKFFSELI
jgi:hypothetical protein